MIEENISGEDEWAIFQTNFDRIHEKFFTNLKERYRFDSGRFTIMRFITFEYAN